MGSETVRAGWPDYPRMVHRAVLIPMLAAIAIGAASAQARPAAAPLERVTVIGDSIATTIQYDAARTPDSRQGHRPRPPTRRLPPPRRRELSVSRGAPPDTRRRCSRRFGCGSTVVVAVGYNDYEETFAASVETVLQALDKAGVEHILWLTLRAERQSYLHMNEIIDAAAASHPKLSAVDWNLYSVATPTGSNPTASISPMSARSRWRH